MAQVTRILTIHPEQPEPELIEQAARVLKQGGLVAFPTETVYGIGALATHETAIAGIYQAKGRQSDNPLIVHIGHPTELDGLVRGINPLAQACIDGFWPGPLTLVLPKQPQVSSVICAGLDTVAIRCPMHPIARALIAAAGPIAAPSANLSGKPSPTTAAHVQQDLWGKVDLIIDGGPATVGLESTVIDPIQGAILRPGSITHAHLQLAGIAITKNNLLMTPKPSHEQPTSPGQKHKHYAPNAHATLVLGSAQTSTQFIKRQLMSQADPHQMAVLTSDNHVVSYTGHTVMSFGQDLTTIAANLYSCLRAFDTQAYQHITQIYVQADFDQQAHPLALSIMDRLIRACNYDVIDTH